MLLTWADLSSSTAPISGSLPLPFHSILIFFHFLAMTLLYFISMFIVVIFLSLSIHARKLLCERDDDPRKQNEEEGVLPEVRVV
jgi:uncharacterized membrane protein